MPCLFDSFHVFFIYIHIYIYIKKRRCSVVSVRRATLILFVAAQLSPLLFFSIVRFLGERGFVEGKRETSQNKSTFEVQALECNERVFVRAFHYCIAYFHLTSSCSLCSDVDCRPVHVHSKCSSNLTITSFNLGLRLTYSTFATLTLR